MTPELETRIRTAVHESAFEHKGSLIQLYAGGSALHGASVPGKADLDVLGIFVEPTEYLFGLGKYEHFVSSTSGDHARNTPDDVDIALYSLRRWAGLAAKGNPTALQFLWAPNVLKNRYWEKVKRPLAAFIPSKKAVNAYRGFVTDQMKRLLGLKGQGKHGQRPELEVKHGYDTKAAMHAIRLVGEGIELMSTGAITFPRPNVEYLRAVRNGALSLDSVCSVVSELLIELDKAEANSPLQAKPNYDYINKTLVDFYENFWWGL